MLAPQTAAPQSKACKASTFSVSNFFFNVLILLHQILFPKETRKQSGLSIPWWLHLAQAQTLSSGPP